MTEEIIETLLSELIIEDFPKRTTGGQNVGIVDTGVKVECLQTSFTITCAYHRSRMKNRDICIKLYRKYLKEIDESQV